MSFEEPQNLSTVCEVIAGQSPKSEFYNKTGEGIAFYQGKKDFGEKYINRPTTWTTKITKEARKDDILMSVRAPVGPINFATQQICIGRGLAAIRASNKINKDFLFYFLLKHESEIVGNVGAVFNSINKTQIGEIKTPVPSLEAQKQIVAILDQAFTTIDQTQANIQHNIQNAQDLFQSKLNQIFSQQGEGWEVRKLIDTCVLQRGFDLPTRLREKGEYLLVSSSGISDTHLVAKVGAPGVVTGRSGSIGNVFYIEEDFWPLNTTLYIKDFKENNEKYIYYLLRHFDLKKYSSGAGVPTLNRNFVHDEIVSSTTSMTEQIKVVELLDELEAMVISLKNSYLNKITETEELKKSLLQKAFSGELTQDQKVA